MYGDERFPLNGVLESFDIEVDKKCKTVAVAQILQMKGITSYQNVRHHFAKRTKNEM